jgi:hypothetical protein
MIQKFVKYLFFINSVYCYAQDKEAISVSYNTNKFNYNDTSATIQQTDVKLRLPLYQKNAVVIATGVGYKNLTLTHFPENYSSPLHGFTLQGIFLYKISQEKKLLFFAQTGLFSDLKDIDYHDFRYSVGVRFRVKHSDKFSSGWGLAYARQFFGNQIVPFIDIDFTPHEKWRIVGQFPVKPKILYYFKKNFSAGLELSGEASSYRLSESLRQNQYIQYNQWASSLKLEYGFAKFWQLAVGAGFNLKQTAKLFNETTSATWTLITIPIGNKNEPVRKIESRGLYFQMGVSFIPDFK